MRVWAQLLWIPLFAAAATAQSADPVVEGLRLVEVASVADAMEQLYGQKMYMAHDMRPLFQSKFAGPAVTVLLKKEEHKEGSPASSGMLDAIDSAPPGSVYVMVVEDGLDIAGMGALMGTAMKVRGLAGAIIDGGLRDTPQMRRIQFPVYSRSIALDIDQPLPFRGHECGSEVRRGYRTRQRHHRSGRGWSRCSAAREGGGSIEARSRTRRHRTSHASVHRKVQVHQRSGGQVRPDLRPVPEDILPEYDGSASHHGKEH